MYSKFLILSSSFPNLVNGAAYSGDAGGIKTTCGDLKAAYKQEACCGNPDQKVHFQVAPGAQSRLAGTNACANKKPAWANFDCFNSDNVLMAIEQSGGDVTLGYTGGFNSSVEPIKTSYFAHGLCPVNVHWHLGAEHRSAGEYDENGKSPNLAGTPSTMDPVKRQLLEVQEVASDGEVSKSGESPEKEFKTKEERYNHGRRNLAGAVRYGYACHLYDSSNANFTKEYNWRHCKDMHVGETYEIHWPHSALGACHQVNQFQFPFYDGVFCGYDGVSALSQETVAGAVGVQGQVFTIINDEDYYYPDLMRGWLKEGNYGKDITAYTGSTTGTSRSNEICSAYAPITWQVDRKCHLISASSFDKMCADMKQERDDFTGDIHPHGARELVAHNMTADNHVDCPACR